MKDGLYYLSLGLLTGCVIINTLAVVVTSSMLYDIKQSIEAVTNE